MYTIESVKEFCGRATDEYLLGQLNVHIGYLATLERHIGECNASYTMLQDAENIRMVVDMERQEAIKRGIL